MTKLPHHLRSNIQRIPQNPVQSRGKIILGVDASLRGTGIGIVEHAGSSFRCVESQRFKMPAKLRVSECLRRIREGVVAAIERCSPEAVSIEGAFYCKNPGTAMILGQARGVVIEACASKGVPVYEYAPRRVKQSVTGFGAADKTQVSKMICSMLGIAEELSDDETDALALAVCHAHSRTGYAALEGEEI